MDEVRGSEAVDGSGWRRRRVGGEVMTVSEPWRTTGHVDSSAHTQDVHTKREGGSTLRDKALWVTGLVSEVNAYSILTVQLVRT